VLELLVLFSLGATGSFVCVWVDLVQRFVARKSRSETVVTGPERDAPFASAPQGDPVLAFGFTVASYGLISLVLVSEFPGVLALERTCLAFAVLCVGGLLREIASSPAAKPAAVDGEREVAPAAREPRSPGLSLTLTLMLNMAFAAVSSGQGLIQIVPERVAVNHAQEIDPIIVVAHRTDEPEGFDPEAL